MARKLRIKVLDIAIVLMAVVLSLTPLLVPASTGGESIVIMQNGEVIYRQSIKTDAIFTTPNGGNTIEIANGQAHMQSANCPDKLCIHMGSVRAGRPVSCIPNGLICFIEYTQTDVDGVTG